VFLPLTTLMYVVLIQGVGSIQGLDWLWLIIAVILDLATIGVAGFANRNRLPGVNSGQTYTAVQDPDQSGPNKPAEPKP
jgi:hypothetical protein